MRLRSHWLIAFAALLAPSAASRALAQPGPPQAPVNQCSIRGQPAMPADAVIYDAVGHPIARFSGARTPLIASDFPSDARGRVRVETGFGAGSFRIRGFIDPGSLPLYTAINIPVSAGHLWIAQNRDVSVLGGEAGRLRIEKKLTTPFEQSFRGSGTCDAFSLDAGVPLSSGPTRDARGYALKQDSLDLYADASSETLIATLHRSPYVGAVLLFGSERRGAYVHVQYRGDVIIDAWAKTAALSALPEGETMDQPGPTSRQHSAPQLALPAQPKLVRPSKEIALRRIAKDDEATIGVIEAGTETYVLDQVAGWASVVPKTLNVLPASDGQFWAKSSELGL